MYNVLEKLRSGVTLSNAEREIHSKGLISILKEIHDDLDQAIAEAYGWSPELSDEQILENLVALNSERAVEEAKGLIRWLRPEYQNPDGVAQQISIDLVEEDNETKAVKHPWPKSLPQQAQAVRNAVASFDYPVESKEIAQRFANARVTAITELLQTLELLGQVHIIEGKGYTV